MQALVQPLAHILAAGLLGLAVSDPPLPFLVVVENLLPHLFQFLGPPARVQIDLHGAGIPVA